jgi:ATP/maltotriose-dependent transcriptional regulator MalT
MTGRRPLQPSTIGRPALEQRLDDALGARRLTCVVAGPGFGKTTLLSHWAETTPHAMSAWHGMTAGDRTLSALVRAVTDALRLCVPGLPTDLVTAVSGPRGPDKGTDEAGRAQAYAGRICAAVAEAHPRPIVLVLDDVEMLDSAPSVAFLAALCRQASPPLHIVVASRGDTPFAVARLRGQGLLAELSAADLDAHHSRHAAEQLRAAGHDVIAGADDPVLAVLIDEELLTWSTRQDRAIVTENARDFDRIARAWAGAAHHHGGIIFTSPRRFHRGSSGYPADLLKALTTLLVGPPAQRQDWVHWL